MSANKWGLLATALTLAGLGFAAMSTNPPFTVLDWVPLAFFVGAGIVLVWLVILLIRNREKKSPTPIKIGASLKETHPISPYARVFNQSKYSEGETISVNVVLSPLKSVKIDAVELRLWGNDYPPKENPFSIIKHSESYTFVFDVPKEVAIDTKDAAIHVMVNGEILPSNLFEIKFGDSK